MRINIERIRRHIEALARFTTTPGAGSTRLSYTPEYRQACEYLAGEAASLGLASRRDAIGNLRMRLAGTANGAPPVVIGSHLDTVIHGGDFDGILGVVAGLEVVQTLVENGLRPTHSIEVISFVEEEGTSFRCPLTGSKALAGLLNVDDLQRIKNDAGLSLHEAARGAGFHPDDLGRDQFAPGQVKAMFELHIEQGAVLESERLAVGIVEHIAGSENYRIRLRGRANHAGTTPMILRYDALACAAQCITAVERVACEPARPNTVATVGRIQCTPNAVNVIPAAVEFSIDVRDIDQACIESAAVRITREIEAIAESRGIGIEVECTGRSAPQPLSIKLVDRLAELATSQGLTHRRMNSGALHDAAMMTQVTEVGMIFVPSKDGRSHTPKEWTDYTDIEQGANLLLAAVVEYAATDG